MGGQIANILAPWAPAVHAIIATEKRMVVREVNASDCLFCKIVRKEVPAKLVDEDDQTLTFEDIDPQAPVHLLVVPKKHIATANDVGPEDEALIGKLFRTAARVARARGFADRGWRGVINCNRDAHQLVFHVHLHVLAGRSMRWPPG